MIRSVFIVIVSMVVGSSVGALAAGALGRTSRSVGETIAILLKATATAKEWNVR
jgi:hypothetical protein